MGGHATIVRSTLYQSRYRLASILRSIFGMLEPSISYRCVSLIQANGDKEDDIKILLNDWPYGIDEDIVHIVVWTKFKFEEQPGDGDLTPSSRKQIDDYITQTFRSRMDAENVLHITIAARNVSD